MDVKNISINTHSSIRIAGSKVLYFDPFQITEETHDADIILITHSHYDHLDPESINRISRESTIFVAPASIEQEMRKVIKDAPLILLTPGDSRDIDGISVQAIPAYNRLKPFHPKHNGWVGYIVTMDGVQYYVAGDTDAIGELSSVNCDIALVPIGGTYTMNAKEAAKLINKIRPQVVIPTHYGSVVGKKEDAESFKRNVDQGIHVELKL